MFSKGAEMLRWFVWVLDDIVHNIWCQFGKSLLETMEWVVNFGYFGKKRKDFPDTR